MRALVAVTFSGASLATSVADFDTVPHLYASATGFKCDNADAVINVRWSSSLSSLQNDLCASSETSLCKTGLSADQLTQYAKDACDSESRCSVAHVDKSTNQIQLLSSACSQDGLLGLFTATDSNSILLTKINAENAEDRYGCLNNELLTLTASECDGDYQRDTTNTNVWVQASGTCQISWSASDCGFVVSESANTADISGYNVQQYCTEEAGMYPSCHNAAVHWIFGQKENGDILPSGYDFSLSPTASNTPDDFCTNAFPWLEGGYCNYGVNDGTTKPSAGYIFTAVCPETCNGCSDTNALGQCHTWQNNDIRPAACVAVKMLNGLDTGACETEDAVSLAGYCDELFVAVGGADKLMVRLCPHTLALKNNRRRLTEEEISGAGESPALNQIFAGLLRDHPIPHRRLSYLTYGADTRYVTWDPMSESTDQAADCDGIDHNLDHILSGSPDMYDIFASTQQVGTMEVSKTCPIQDNWKYMTNTICTSNNLNPVTLGDSISNLRCGLCGGSDADRVAAEQANAGLDCRGHDDTRDGDFTDSFALCTSTTLAMQMCLSLNTAGVVCSGIEWHNSKPRIFLNGAACQDGDDIASSLKTSNSDYNFVLISQGRTSYSLNGFRTGCASSIFAQDMARWNIALDAATSGDGDWLPGVAAAAGVQTFTVTDGVALSVEDAMVFCDQTSSCGGVASLPDGNVKFLTDDAGSCSDWDGSSDTFHLYARDKDSVTGRYTPDCFAIVANSGGYDGTYTRYDDDATCGGLITKPCYGNADSSAFLIDSRSSQLKSAYPSLACTSDEKLPTGMVLVVGSPAAATPDFKYASWVDGKCPENPHVPAFPIEDTDLWWGELYDQWYPFKPLLETAAALSFSCSGYSRCPPTTTCVLGSERFNVEVDSAMATQTPKTLVTELAAVSLVSKQKWQWSGHIGRSSADSNVGVRILEWPAGQEGSLQIRLNPTSGNYWSNNFEAFLSDSLTIIGLEGSNTVKMEVSMANCNNALGMAVGIQGQSAPIDGTRSDHSTSNGCSFEYSFGAGTHIFAQEKPCPALPAAGEWGVSSISNCDGSFASATCAFSCGVRESPSAGGSLVCSEQMWRPSQYVSGDLCTPVVYSDPTSTIRIVQTARMEYGWRIRQINLYSDPSCTGNTVDTSDATITSSAFDSDLGPVLKSDQGDAGSIWSDFLNLNPREVDQTHGDSVVIDIVLASGTAAQNVRCVEVVSRNLDGVTNIGTKEYYPETIAVYWGAGNQVGKPSGTHTFQDFLTYSTASAEDNGDSVRHQASLSIGETAPVAYGEEEGAEATAGLLYCAQLAIERYDLGVRNWRFDTSAEAGSVNCVLFTSLSMADECHDPGDHFISGDVGIRVESFSPLQVSAGSLFDVTLSGAFMRNGLYVEKPWSPSQQRIKLVDTTDPTANHDCDAADSPFVAGIRCVKNLICSHPPSDTSPTSVTFDNLRITSPGTRTYKFCYNPGSTYDRLRWVTLQDANGDTQELTVEGYHSWALSGSTGSSVGKLASGTVNTNVVVSGPALTETTWDIKLVKKSQSCSATEDSNVYNNAVVSTGAGERTFQVSVEDDADIGDYRVCFSSDGTNFFPVSSADKPYFNVAHPAGYTPGAAGFYTEQLFSGAADGDITLSLQGHKLADVCDSDISIGIGSATVLDLTIDCAIDLVGDTASVTVPGPSAGSYVVTACFGDGCTVTPVGTLTVTDAVRVDHNWVLTPDEVSALEILGTGINPVKNRVMITSCNSACGQGAASPSVFINDQPANQRTFNTWLPLYQVTDPPQNASEYGYKPADAPIARIFTKIENTACNVNHMLSSLSEKWDSKKCSACSDPHSTNAACQSGYLGAYDDQADVHSYCMTDQEARDASSELDGVKAFIRHRSMPTRHYFYSTCDAAGAAELSASHSDDQYDLYYLAGTVANTAGATAPTPITRYNDNQDSWSEIGRWTDLTFHSGGEYRVCMCDGSSGCNTKSDYTIDVGKIHVSGVSCLLEDNLFQQHCCRPTTVDGMGGYSCWDTACRALPSRTYAADPDIAHQDSVATTPTPAPSTTPDCIGGPEESSTGGCA